MGRSECADSNTCTRQDSEKLYGLVDETQAENHILPVAFLLCDI